MKKMHLFPVMILVLVLSSVSVLSDQPEDWDKMTPTERADYVIANPGSWEDVSDPAQKLEIIQQRPEIWTAGVIDPSEKGELLSSNPELWSTHANEIMQDFPGIKGLDVQGNGISSFDYESGSLTTGKGSVNLKEVGGAGLGIEVDSAGIITLTGTNTAIVEGELSITPGTSNPIDPETGQSITTSGAKISGITGINGMKVEGGNTEYNDATNTLSVQGGTISGYQNPGEQIQLELSDTTISTGVRNYVVQEAMLTRSKEGYLWIDSGKEATIDNVHISSPKDAVLLNFEEARTDAQTYQGTDYGESDYVKFTEPDNVKSIEAAGDIQVDFEQGNGYIPMGDNQKTTLLLSGDGKAEVKNDGGVPRVTGIVPSDGGEWAIINGKDQMSFAEKGVVLYKQQTTENTAAPLSLVVNDKDGVSLVRAYDKEGERIEAQIVWNDKGYFAGLAQDEQLDAKGNWGNKPLLFGGEASALQRRMINEKGIVVYHTKFEDNVFKDPLADKGFYDAHMAYVDMLISTQMPPEMADALRLVSVDGTGTASFRFKGLDDGISANYLMDPVELTDTSRGGMKDFFGKAAEAQFMQTMFKNGDFWKELKESYPLVSLRSTEDLARLQKKYDPNSEFWKEFEKYIDTEYNSINAAEFAFLQEMKKQSGKTGPALLEYAAKRKGEVIGTLYAGTYGDVSELGLSKSEFDAAQRYISEDISSDIQRVIEFPVGDATEIEPAGDQPAVPAEKMEELVEDEAGENDEEPVLPTPTATEEESTEQIAARLEKDGNVIETSAPLQICSADGSCFTPIEDTAIIQDPKTGKKFAEIDGKLVEVKEHEDIPGAYKPIEESTLSMEDIQTLIDEGKIKKVEEEPVEETTPETEEETPPVTEPAVQESRYKGYETRNIGGYEEIGNGKFYADMGTWGNNKVPYTTLEKLEELVNEQGSVSITITEPNWCPYCRADTSPSTIRLTTAQADQLGLSYSGVPTSLTVSTSTFFGQDSGFTRSSDSSSGSGSDGGSSGDYDQWDVYQGDDWD